MTDSIGWFKYFNLLIFEEIDSTNSEAIRLAKQGVLNGNFVIWAHKQTNGRGRKGKIWVSHESNLLFSVWFNSVKIPVNEQPLVSFAASLAVYKAIDKVRKIHFYNSRDISFLNNFDLKLKWPNDVLLNEKKISGILIEALKVNNVSHLIVGIGVNVKHAPQNITRISTDLLSYDINTSPGELLNLIIIELHKLFIIWRREGFSKIRNLWIKKAYKLNQEVILQENENKFIKGIFRDIDEMGNIQIEDSLGKIYTSANHVIFEP